MSCTPAAVLKYCPEGQERHDAERSQLPLVRAYPNCHHKKQWTKEKSIIDSMLVLGRSGRGRRGRKGLEFGAPAQHCQRRREIETPPS